MIDSTPCKLHTAVHYTALHCSTTTGRGNWEPKKKKKKKKKKKNLVHERKKFNVGILFEGN